MAGYRHPGTPPDEVQAVRAELIKANRDRTRLYRAARAARAECQALEVELTAQRVAAEKQATELGTLREALATQIDLKEKAQAEAGAHRATFRRLLEAAHTTETQ